MVLTVFNIPDVLVLNGSFATKTVKSIQVNTAKTAGTGTTDIYFGNPREVSIQWIFTYSNTATLTGSAQIGLNNTALLTAMSGTLGTGMFTKYSAGLVVGKNNFKISDTANSLAYSDLSVEFLTAS